MVANTFLVYLLPFDCHSNKQGIYFFTFIQIEDINFFLV